LASQARRLAALLALRQLGSEQYFWCLALRGSARNIAPQNRHLSCSGRAMTHPPCAESSDATARHTAHYERVRTATALIQTTPEMRGRRDRKTLEIKIDEENRRRKSTKKIHDFQTARFKRLSERR
jgi:hypothetical protein